MKKITGGCLLQFNQQWRHYQSTMQVFRLQPDQYNQSLDELTMFVAQVIGTSSCWLLFFTSGVCSDLTGMA